MKNISRLLVVSTFGASMLVACADRDGGFEAHRPTKEDVILRQYRNLTPAEQQAFALRAAQPGQMRQWIQAESVGPVVPPRVAAPAPQAAAPALVEGQSATALVDADRDGLKAELTAVGADPKDKAGKKITIDEKAIATQSRIEAINAIAEQTGVMAASVVRGFDVFVRQAAKDSADGADVQMFDVTIDSVMQINGQDYLISGKARLSEKDQSVNSRLADMELAARDALGNPVQIAGVEMSASFLRKECDQVLILIKVEGKDHSAVAVNAVFELADSKGATKVLSSTLGDAHQSFAKAQDALGKKTPAAAPPAAAAPAAKGLQRDDLKGEPAGTGSTGEAAAPAAAAPAGTGEAEVVTLQRVEVIGHRMTEAEKAEYDRLQQQSPTTAN